MKEIKKHHHLDGKDDRHVLTYKQLGKMNRFEVFEHSFPFYLMDVSGYVMHIKEAMHDSHPGVEL